MVFEMFFFARKGTRGLIKPFVDLQFSRRVAKDERVFAAEKPVELLEHLIDVSTLPGDKILDPCCGSASTLVAAKNKGRLATGIEKDQSTYNTALAKLFRETDHETSTSLA